MKKGINRLKIKEEGYEVYGAGIPTYARNFTRDAIISSLLMEDSKMMKNQLMFSAHLQGKKKDNFTGEEPGKIFHEHPAVIKRGLSPEFNASDTTALFLLGHEIYQKWTRDRELAEKQKENIKKAVGYIKSHLKGGAFIESPKFWGAKKGSLNVTYWKDSEIVDRESGVPAYPVTYFLNQVQNYRGMKSAYFLLKDEKIKKDIAAMKNYIDEKFYDKKEKRFYIAIDKKGPVGADSSDELHSLFYFGEDELKPEIVDNIVRNSSAIETDYGYRTLSEKDSYRVSDPYHAMTLWPFEQAIINIGAKKFNLKKVEQISSRIVKHLDTAPEIFDILSREKGKVFKKGGCDPQLWTLAAKEYFKNQEKYRIVV